MIHHEYCDSHVSASSIYASPSSKQSCVISSGNSYIFKDSTKKLDVEIGILIFNNGLPFRTCDSRDMDDIILKTKKVPREYNITSSNMTRGKIMDVCYTTMRERQTRHLFNEA